jgi:hypothetical protein
MSLHRSFEGDVGWGDDEVEMVGHDDVGVQKIAGAVVVDGFEEEYGVALDWKSRRRLWVAVVMK